MAKPPKANETYSEKEALERMNKALKKAMDTKPKPHKEMAGGRQRQGGRPRKADK